MEALQTEMEGLNLLEQRLLALLENVAGDEESRQSLQRDLREVRQEKVRQEKIRRQQAVTELQISPQTSGATCREELTSSSVRS